MVGMEMKKEMEAVCCEFLAFCDYLVNNKVKLSKTTWYIGRKDCFELNSLFRVKESFEKATHSQNQYPVIHFFYYVALKCRILEIDYTKCVLVRGKHYEVYEQSSELEKYILLVVYALHDMRFVEQDSYCKMNVRQLLDWLWENEAVANEERLLPNNAFRWLAFDSSRITPLLEELCLVKILEKTVLERVTFHGKTRINVLPLYELVAKAYNSISEDVDIFWDIDIEECLEQYLDILIPNFQCSNIMQIFQQIHSMNTNQAIDLEVKIRYTDVVRVIRMSMSDSLYSLHSMIQKAVQFDDDHLFEFYVGQGLFKQTYAIREAFTSGEEKDVEDTTLGELELCKGMKISYLFDFGDMWWFDIKVLDVLDTTVQEPMIIKEVNPAPEQYPYYDE